MNGLKTVMGKELTRVFKDKKMVFSMFILPVLLIIGIYALIFSLIDSKMDDIEKHDSIVYVQNAPEGFQAFVDTLDVNTTITYLKASDDLQPVKDQILNGDTDLLLVFPETFTADITNKDQVIVPQIKTFYNPSEDYSAQARDTYLANVLEPYRLSLLSEKFGDLNKVSMFSIDSDNPDSVIQDDEKASGKVLGTLLPYFVTLLLFAGAMGLGVDVIAGEKERGTLSSLLLSPVKRSNIVMGKLMALGLMSILSAIVYMVSMIVAFPIAMNSMADEDTISEISLSFTPTQIIQFVILMFGVVLMYVAIIAVIAVFAKSVKEATTYVSPAYILVLVAGMVTMYKDSSSLVEYAIPLYNSSVAFNGILTREITTPEFLLTVVSTYAFAAILVAVITKAFNSEKVMFNA